MTRVSCVATQDIGRVWARVKEATDGITSIMSSVASLPHSQIGAISCIASKVYALAFSTRPSSFESPSPSWAVLRRNFYGHVIYLHFTNTTIPDVLSDRHHHASKTYASAVLHVPLPPCACFCSVVFDIMFRRPCTTVYRLRWCKTEDVVTRLVRDTRYRIASEESWMDGLGSIECTG
jgi:hypothetical protein